MSVYFRAFGSRFECFEVQKMLCIFDALNWATPFNCAARGQLKAMGCPDQCRMAQATGCPDQCRMAQAMGCLEQKCPDQCRIAQPELVKLT
jgi:hypothetical protein